MTKKEITNDSINIIAQFFYGNRTGTSIKKEHVDYFLRGCLGDYHPSDIKDVVRKVVHVPNSNDLVVVYDQTQEDEYVNVTFPAIYAEEGKEYLERCGKELKMHVSCEIPEIGFKIHTRCIACRMNSAGDFKDILPEDYSVVAQYFAE